MDDVVQVIVLQCLFTRPVDTCDRCYLVVKCNPVAQKISDIIPHRIRLDLAQPERWAALLN